MYKESEPQAIDTLVRAERRKLIPIIKTLATVAVFKSSPDTLDASILAWAQSVNVALKAQDEKHVCRLPETHFNASYLKGKTVRQVSQQLVPFLLKNRWVQTIPGDPISRQRILWCVFTVRQAIDNLALTPKDQGRLSAGIFPVAFSTLFKQKAGHTALLKSRRLKSLPPLAQPEGVAQSGALNEAAISVVPVPASGGI